MSLYEDKTLASQIIRTDYRFLHRFERIYPFATENIPGALSGYNFKDKRCLTVLGSSSQLVYMYLNGAKEVDSFDINPLTIYYFYFIKAFLQSGLSQSSLLVLFKGICNAIDNADKIYYTIEKYLYNDAYKFWNYVYENYGISGFCKLFQCLESDDINLISEYCGYLTLENIKEARKVIKDVEPKFINCNIKELPQHLNNYYDLIYLSNIIQYVDTHQLYDCFNGNIYPLEEYKKLMYELNEYLTTNGLLYIGYIYTPEDIINKSTPIFDKKSREKVFPKDEFIYNYFDTYKVSDYDLDYDLDYEKDACLIMKKKG